MVGTRTPTTRRRSARFARRYAATESSRRPALECILAHDGPGGRSIEVSERNFFAELKRRDVYKVAVVLSWAFELTPEGIKRENEVDRKVARKTGRKLTAVVVVVAAAATGLML